VLHGTPTPEELAALVGVLFGRRRPTATPDRPAAPSLWTTSGRPGYANGPGQPTRPGAHAWRASALSH
jgi:hypothetical protein